MSDQPDPASADRDGAPEPVVADRVAQAVRSVPGVADLHAGAFAQVGTLLPGRRVDGVRVGEQSTEIHLSVTMGTAIAPLADAVTAAVRPITGTPVEIVVEDVVPVETDPPGPSEPGTTPSSEENH